MSFELKFILVMVSMILADVCWTMYFIEVDKRRAMPAGLWSGAIILFTSITTVNYVTDRRLLVAAILGAIVGTAGTIYYKNRNK